MADDWAFPENLRPDPRQVRFDLEAAVDGVVALRAEIPPDAFTASILGTLRSGNGIVIDDGLVLTIGYLITEAHTVWLTTNDSRVVPAHPLAYDQATGFGLVRALGSLDLPALARGRTAATDIGDDVFVLGHGGQPHALKATVIAKREFAGYWEYVLDEALFTAPAHPQWGGAALVSTDGRVLGVGSLLVGERVGDQTIQGNMVVPIDLLEPILADMLRLGHANRPPRPWLGMYTAQEDDVLIVGGLAERGPAEDAGVQVGDVVLEVAGQRPSGLADLFRKVWRLGDAGVEVPLTVARDEGPTRLRLRSADRNDFLKKPRLH